MALSKARRLQLTEAALPSDAVMRERALLFMRRAGMLITEMADEIGYARTSLGQYLNGVYDAHHERDQNTLAMRSALKEYIDLHDMQTAPAALGRHHKTAATEEVRRCALNALRKGTAYVVDGPPGTEKTWSLRQIEREVAEKKLGRALYVYARVNHSPQSFLQECCMSAGIPSRGSIDQLIRKLRFFLGAGRTLLMVDEAQHLAHDCLEVLRQLLDLPPYFGVVLAGSHDLSQRLGHWQMEQWRSRLRKKIYLNGPTDKEARAILRAELGAVSEADCTATIAQCMAQGARVQMAGGKPKQVPFDYISARDLFGAIDRVKEAMHTPQQLEGAA